MIRHTLLFLFCAGMVGLPSNLVDAAEPEKWKAGVATVNVTPQTPMFMAGYASRTKPSEGVLSELNAKALAIEDSAGTRAVIVTTDLISIPRVLRDPVVAAVESKYKLPGRALLLNCSHTHCGPIVKDNLELSVMYRLEPEQRQRVEHYFVELRDKLVSLVGAALDDLKPARVSYSHARCGFAMNRRLPTSEGYQNSAYPDGPVDHDVPVLRVETEEGKLRAVAFGYACHNTTTALQQFNADYAGFAQSEIEAAHPGVTALFVMGCGGDQNPYPRGQIELARSHGKTLALAVEAALLPVPKPLQGPLKVDLDEVELVFEPVTRAELTARLDSKDIYIKRAAESLLTEADKLGKVRENYSAPIQALQFGGDLTLIAMPGETVIDYSLRLKRELGNSSAVWVAGYSNDVFAYIPSERVLREGGYEASGAMRYTSLPGPFQPNVESLLMSNVTKLVERLRHEAIRK